MRGLRQERGGERGIRGSRQKLLPGSFTPEREKGQRRASWRGSAHFNSEGSSIRTQREKGNDHKKKGASSKGKGISARKKGFSNFLARSMFLRNRRLPQKGIKRGKGDGEVRRSVEARGKTMTASRKKSDIKGIVTGKKKKTPTKRGSFYFWGYVSRQRSAFLPGGGIGGEKNIKSDHTKKPPQKRTASS